MENESYKYQIGANIADLRKKNGLTQAALADQLIYCDKAVSKWERGESVPDIPTLIQLAQLFGVSVDSLIGLTHIPAQSITALQRRRQERHVWILRLSSLLVWFVALLIYVVLSSIGVKKSWVSFIYAVPINAIVLLVLRSAWRDFKWNQTLISVIVWGALLSLYSSLLLFLGVNVWRLIFLGVLGQMAVYLWFRMLRVGSRADNG